MLDLDYKDVAEKYGGNKQKIAQAAALGSLGPEGPLLAVAAGMYIDRMRAAQMQEQVPQQTVAQQVLSPQPPQQPMPSQGLPGAVPPQQPMSPQGGLGAVAPQGGMDMAEPSQDGEVAMADGGMVPPYAMGGGLSDLPVPDTMFDEPSNGGYANGGLVAFAKGGMSNLYDAIEYWESGGKQAAISPKGARGVMQLMPGTMRNPGFGIAPMQNDSEDENRRVGREYADALYRKYGDQKLALMAYNWGTGNVDKWLKSGADPKKLPSETRAYVNNILKGNAAPLPERDFNTAEGRRRSIEDQVGIAKGMFNKLPDSGLDEAADYYHKQRSPEENAKGRKYDMWTTLAQIGASMASTSSPSFLQAAGQAMAAAIPGASAAKKERDKAERDAVGALMEISGLKRKEAKEVLEYGKDLYTSEARAEGEQTDREFRAAEAAKERNWRSDEARKAEKAAEALAKIRTNPSDMESAIFIMQNGTKEQKAALEAWLQLKQKYGAQGQQGNPFGFPNPTQQGGGTAAPINVGGWDD